MRLGSLLIIFSIFLNSVLLSGCMDQQTKATENISPIQTVTEAAKPTIIASNISNDDKGFLDAANVCYLQTPSITNITTHTSFTKCMQNTPKPESSCAQNFRTFTLKYMNDDDTTSGYSRMTYNMYLLRNAYNHKMMWNSTKVRFEPCIT